MDYIALFEKCKEEKLHGRYVTNKHIEPLLINHSKTFLVEEIGFSVQKKSIKSVKIGHGKIKILMWSQMHGNESTTTKAVFDMLNWLQMDSDLVENILNRYTILCIPILDPDGAEVYTRENANLIDLNRDFLDLSQPESNLLLKVYHEFKPNFCYNLHDQRTIYAAGNTRNPATVSFLAPSYNEAREINNTRSKAISVIVSMNRILQSFIPNQVGRFDDEYNPNCVGETFQSLNTPTILFESGHFPGDYQREETRKYIFIALVSSFQAINDNVVVNDEIHSYLDIPQNNPIFFDFIYKKVKINYNSSKLITTFAAHFNEILLDEEVIFEACISQIGDEGTYFGHQEYDCEGATYSDDFNNIPEMDMKANFYLNKSIKFVNGLRNL